MENNDDAISDTEVADVVAERPSLEINLYNGCLLQNTLTCPESLVYCFSVDPNDSNRLTPLKNLGKLKGVSNEKRYKEGWPIQYNGNWYYSPLQDGFGIVFDQLSYYELHTTSGNQTTPLLLKYRPFSKYVYLSPSGYCHKFRYMYECLTSHGFTNFSGDYLSKQKVQQRDVYFNELFGYADVPRLLVTKKADTSNAWELADSDFGGDCLDRQAYFRLLGGEKTFGKKESSLIDPSFGGLELYHQKAVLDSIAIMEASTGNFVDIDGTHDAANLECWTVQALPANKFGLGEKIADSNLVSAFTDFIRRTGPTSPNAVSDLQLTTTLIVDAAFQHGETMLLKVLKAETKKRKPKVAKEKQQKFQRVLENNLKLGLLHLSTELDVASEDEVYSRIRTRYLFEDDKMIELKELMSEKSFLDNRIEFVNAIVELVRDEMKANYGPLIPEEMIPSQEVIHYNDNMTFLRVGGAPFPAPSDDSERINLGNVKGRVLVVDFWHRKYSPLSMCVVNLPNCFISCHNY
jgi:hypothetical protein